ncbi:MAG: PAS domain S-box protein [Desulfarculus sp.]|nr:PAS domain S-box protein [Desulfarculus sp.]
MSSRAPDHRPARLVFVVLLLAALLAPGLAPARAQTPGPAPASQVPQSILLLYSAGFYLPAYRKNIAAFFTVMEAAGFPVNRLHFEHLDLIRHGGPEHQRRVLELLRAKYAGQKIDLIITVEGLARDLILKHGQDLLPQTPLLAILSADSLDTVPPGRRVVQIPSVLDMAGTLKVGLSLFPQTRRVFVVVGSGEDEQRWEREARSQFAPWAGKLDFEYSGGLTYEETLERIGTLPSDSMAIYIALYKDKAGRSFAPRDAAIALTRRANAPVFGVYDEITPLLVGGSMISYGAEGARAAKMALDILAGKTPLNEPLTTAPILTAPSFNWRQLERWGVSGRALPPGSIVINRPPSIWDDYQEEVVGGVMLFLLQAGMILALLAMRRRSRRAEASRREAEDRYRRIVDTANEGIAVVDASLRFTFVNQKMADMLGYRPEEMMGRGPEEFMPPGELEAHLRNMESRRQGQGETYERRFLRQDGQEVWFLVSAVPILDRRGQFIGSFAMFTDITDRKLMEEDLRESRRFLSDLIEHSGALIFVKDRQGRYELVNRRWEEVTGLKREQVLGRTDEELFPGEIGRQFRQNDLEAMESGGALEREEILDDTSGRRYFLSVKFPLLGPDGQVRGVCGMTTEITERRRADDERRRMEDQLRQAQKMEAVGTLAGGIAHDFNNILAAVLGFAEMAREDAQEGKVNPADLDRIIASAQRAKALVQQILAFSRKSEAHLEPVDLNQAVVSTREILERTLPKMIAIETRLAPRLPPVWADATQLQQVLLNLAANARDAMPEGGRLTLATNQVTLDREYCRQHLEVRPGAYALLTVADTGLGMDPDTRSHIFEPFFTTKEVGKGTDLGLSSAYGIVKSHGGHIHCYSEPGLGTTFRVYLPLAGEWSESQPEEAPPGGEQSPGGTETILLVDDEEALRDLGARTLEAKGYRVLTAANGEQALALFGGPQGRPGLVVMDLGMPGMGGHKALRALLEIDPQVKVVIASGYWAEGQVKEALESGAAGYVAKPFRRAELLGTVRAILDGK